MPLNESSTLLAMDRELQRSLADAIPIMVMVADADGVVEYFNKAWHEYTGQAPFYRDTDLTWQEYIHPDDCERVTQEWLHIVRSGKRSVEMQHRIRSASGEYRWFQTKAIALQDDTGAVRQWIGFAMDIEQERRKQDEATALYTDLKSVAIRLQQSSLPPSLRKVDGIRFQTLYAPSIASLTICGDWYDAFLLPDGSLGISVGDVNGHGIEAAVLMGKIRYSLRAIAMRVVSLRTGTPDSILTSVEETLESEHLGEFATAFLGIISVDRKSIQYSSAGHPPPLAITRTGDAVWFNDGDPPIGFGMDTKRHSYVADLSMVSHLLLYTDGIIEAGRDIIAGLDRLESAAKNLCGPGTDCSLDDVVRQALLAPAHDDIAALLLSFTPR